MLKPVVALLFIAYAGKCLPQNPTTPPSNASQNDNKLVSAWQDGTIVTVFIDGNSYPPGSAAEAAIWQGFQNDLAAYSPRVSNYDFVNVTTPPNLSYGQVYVTPTTFSDPNMRGLNTWISSFNGPVGNNMVDHALIQLSTSITNNPAALTYVVAHEESHDNALGDCPTCGAFSSIMSYQGDINNPPLFAPTLDDVGASFTFDPSFGGGDGGGSGNNPCPGPIACPSPK